MPATSPKPAGRKKQQYRFWLLDGPAGRWWVRAKSEADAKPVYAFNRVGLDRRQLIGLVREADDIPTGTKYLVRERHLVVEKTWQ